METIYGFDAKTIEGKGQNLGVFKDKVLLIVNTASLCGFTPQYEGLQNLYSKYKDQGFMVLGFPCDQFGQQEPGDSSAIKDFCLTKFAISFPLFEKIDVNGPNTHPLFQYLKKNSPGLLGTEAIKWNFTKFLINRKGTVVHRYAPTTKPEAIASDIEALLLKNTTS